jgi:hypothetical protein
MIGMLFNLAISRVARDNAWRENLLEDAVSRLQAAIDDVESAMSDVQSSCGYRGLPPPAPIEGVSSLHQRLCTTIQRAERTLGVAAAMNLCKPYMPENEYNACLATKK